jgi:hypothetical protein
VKPERRMLGLRHNRPLTSVPGTFRTWRDVRPESEMRSIADMGAICSACGKLEITRFSHGLDTTDSGIVAITLRCCSRSTPLLGNPPVPSGGFFVSLKRQHRRRLRTQLWSEAGPATLNRGNSI